MTNVGIGCRLRLEQISRKGDIKMNLKPLASNMTEVKIGDKKVLFSYETPVACYNPGLIRTNPYFKTNKFWSKTTTKHINKWLNGQVAVEIPQEELDNLLNEVK